MSDTSSIEWTDATWNPVRGCVKISPGCKNCYAKTFAERFRDLLQTRLKGAADHQHIWWGVSVEDRKYGLPRIEHLRRSGARMKMLSIEPLLEDLGEINLQGINWVIVGGESGPGARPMQ